MEIGTIKAVHIYVHEQIYVTAELELNIKGVNYIFGGHRVFLSGMHGGESCDAPYLGRFLFRCMHVCNVESWDLLKSSKVLADIRDGRVIAIGSTSGHNWFNPTKEFQIMEDEKEQTGTSSRINSKTSG
ncbi:hypothetical protein [Dyadobacter sp. MSC1_007]|jgi:hypothetical protein|uniref:hypothetical protein n=1 Tax=Dyadobacter sp. MSC1_007 TaxID=2909264 RepID=UPI0020304785|nr:hypothetical protein [Dyadobacter sp. MSC1_007]